MESLQVEYNEFNNDISGPVVFGVMKYREQSLTQNILCCSACLQAHVSTNLTKELAGGEWEGQEIPHLNLHTSNIISHYLEFNSYCV